MHHQESEQIVFEKFFGKDVLYSKGNKQQTDLSNDFSTFAPWFPRLALRPALNAPLQAIQIGLSDRRLTRKALNLNGTASQS